MILPASVAQNNELIALLKTTDKSTDSFKKIYSLVKKYHHDKKKLPTNFDNFLSNYLAVNFIKFSFPWNPIQGNLFLSFIPAIIPVFLVKLFIMIIIEENNKITDAEIVKIIYSVERELGHNKRIIQHVAQTQELLRLDTYLACLKDI